MMRATTTPELALDAAATVGLDATDFAALALLAIDQAGASLPLQAMVRALLAGAGLLAESEVPS